MLLIYAQSKIYDHSSYTQLAIKKFTFFFIQYNDEGKERKSRRQKKIKKANITKTKSNQDR